MSQMPKKRTSSRRDFLHGRSIADAMADLADQVDPYEEGPSGGSVEVSGALDTVRGARLLRFTRQAMACQFEVALDPNRCAGAAEAAIEALDLVDRLEDQLTVYRDDSEVMDINRTAAAGPVTVETRLFELLQLSLVLYEQTHRAFDITSGPLSKVWGFFRRQGKLPERDQLDRALQNVGCDKIVLDAQDETVRFLGENVEINLGSIGKGYALDRAAATIEEAGVTDFLLHGGKSSVVARGNDDSADGESPGWTIGIGHPLRPAERLAQIRLSDAALGTSGTASQFFRHKGRRYGHILDPRTGWPAEGVLSATVMAPSAAVADALATAFYVLGPEQSLTVWDQRPEISALFVCPGKKSGSVTVHTLGFDDSNLTWLCDC